MYFRGLHIKDHIPYAAIGRFKHGHCFTSTATTIDRISIHPQRRQMEHLNFTTCFMSAMGTRIILLFPLHAGRLSIEQICQTKAMELIEISN
ncbi:hypothetical protein Patl1_19332 [Pistacia atlantica]|uniref:Uncharacterized protein n=1 Tax=Pistacia atlantica TaxID=434234 RepID=A0ACC1C2H4_9ROSI|nr:hypothetical protein Patl1_19332 [Pistacia atlantica]